MILIHSSSGNFITTTENKEKNRRKKRTSRSFLAILLLIMAIVLTSLFSPFFNIININVKGNKTIDSQSIIDASGIEKGINIFRVNIGEAKQNICQIPYIDSVKINRNLPSRITITVIERKPVGYIPFMGSYILIDRKGNVLEVVSQLTNKNLPIIRGLKFNEFKLGETIQVDQEKKLAVIVSCMKEIINYQLLQQVSQIDVHDINSIQLTIEDRIKVNLGDSLKMNYKVNFLKQILDELQDGEKGYVDLSNEDRATFRPNE
ncbi:MAG: cell division protein FtsQ [Clostridiales bacterium]|jgi:cell division protein FtsQ|nr:cell division protein FtsQ [Clostridiales bacterium]MDK2932752.1 cell division protein FtsQ [Clostridiales bacterium]